MDEEGVTWGHVEGCKVGLDIGLATFLRRQWEVQGGIKTPSVQEWGFAPDTPPMAALFVMVSMGLYPPPELMLAMLQAFIEYLEAEGRLELEDVFFGKPRQRAGNYARRRKKGERDFKMTVRYWIEKRRATTRKGEGPAERATGGQVTEETLRRLMRAHPELKKLADNEALVTHLARVFAEMDGAAK